MKDELIELLKNCKTEEEAMKLLQDQKIELTDEELEELKGGTIPGFTIFPFMPC